MHAPRLDSSLASIDITGIPVCKLDKKTKRKKVKEALSQKLDIKLQYIKPIFYNNKYNRKIAHEKGLPW